MAHIDIDALKGANADSIAAATEANNAIDDLQEKRATLIVATRDYNSALADTKSKFETAERKIAAESTLTDGIAQQTGDFPEPVDEPAPWPQLPIASKSRAKK